MRRTISLYINGAKADLDDDSFILYNYVLEDLDNPAIVRNNFSHQITLPGTANNNAIFGGYYRLDHVIGTGYNPTEKVPFAIYDGTAALLESGYMRLDSVTKNNGIPQYNISLYGRLGSFLYSLAYDENGNRRTLADLDYLQTASSETELDFTINAQTLLDAWSNNFTLQAVTNKWRVVNFAPCLNGIPDGNFSADKAVVDLSDISMPQQQGHDGKSGYTIVNFASPKHEWEVKDCRSYLQRPILSMYAFLSAVARPENNGGYDVEMRPLDASSEVWNRTWLTLPMLPSLGTGRQESGDLSVSMSTTATSAHQVGRYNISGSVSAGAKIIADLHCKLQMHFNGTDTSLSMYATQQTSGSISTKEMVVFAQAVARDSNGNVLGGSKIVTMFNWRYATAEKMAEECGFTPVFPADYEVVDRSGSVALVSSRYFNIGKEMSFHVEAYNVSYYTIEVYTYRVETYSNGSQAGTRITSVSGGNLSTGTAYVNFSTARTADLTRIAAGSIGNTITYSSSGSLRSNAKITKRMLLSTSATPADYLIAMCKVFHWKLFWDEDKNKVRILPSDEFYDVDTTIDLTGRVDLSKPVQIEPYLFKSKWYNFELEGVGGAYADEYASLQGVPYGIQRVDTGYDFDSNEYNLMDGVVLKSGVTILDKSPFYCTIYQSGEFFPSVFKEPGATYTLWDLYGNSQDFSLSVPKDNAQITQYNTSFPGYNIPRARMMEFRDKDNKAVDGSNVLVVFGGRAGYSDISITDDLPIMDNINNGVPCWRITSGRSYQMPMFGRYEWGNSTAETNIMEQSLDFGVPRELDMPGVVYDENTTIYKKRWKSYITDRFDANTKVMRCRVDFSGIGEKVSLNLLSYFYWYDGSLWSLNAIRNYSLTTYDFAECEFVQVQNKSNY